MSSRTLRSADGRLAVPYADITHVCITPSIHALLQYLLLVPDDVAMHHTAYFLGYAVAPAVASHLPAVVFSEGQTADRNSLRRALVKAHTRCSAPRRYPFLATASIYAFDVGFAPAIIGSRPYALLSDGPLGISQNMQPSSVEYQRQQRRAHSLQGRLERLFFGPVAVAGWGNNSQCTAFYLTEENDAEPLHGKPCHIASFGQLWQQASEATHTLVRTVFDVADDDIALLSSRSTIFLTQPFVDDRLLSEQQYVELLTPIFDHYGQSNLLLKLHPRDTFDYRRHFPQVAVFDKVVNMQLLVLLGTSVQRAATICSSSINSFPDQVEADWFGPEIHPALAAHFGRMVTPRRPFNMMTGF